MRSNIRIDGLMVLTGALVAGGALLYMKRGAIGQGVAAVADKVNPSSTNNIVYQGVNAIGDIAGDGNDNNNFDLGVWLWEITHPEQVKAEREFLQ
jgi:hypothetical protein